jgi:hypothetical protein
MRMLPNLGVEVIKPTKVAWRHFTSFFKCHVHFYIAQVKILYDLFFAV